MVWCSALVAALFAVHPTHLQSVAWIAERKDVLSGFFMMLTLLCYATAVARGEGRVAGGRGQGAENKALTSSPDSPPATRHPSLFYWLAVVFFALGVMSKPMLVSLPIILLLLDVWPLGRVTSDKWQVTRFGLAVPQLTIIKRLLWEKLPFVVFSAISCLATLRAQGGAGFIIHVAPLPWYVRVIITPYFYVAYLRKILWPENLCIFYQYPLVQPWQIAVAALLLIAITVVCLRQLRARPYLAIGWFWFLVMLVPVIGFVQVGTQSIADRYTYLPSIGLFIMVAWGLPELAARATALADRRRRGCDGIGAGLPGGHTISTALLAELDHAVQPCPGHQAGRQFLLLLLPGHCALGCRRPGRRGHKLPDRPQNCAGHDRCLRPARIHSPPTEQARRSRD